MVPPEVRRLASIADRRQRKIEVANASAMNIKHLIVALIPLIKSSSERSHTIGSQEFERREVEMPDFKWWNQASCYSSLAPPRKKEQLHSQGMPSKELSEHEQQAILGLVYLIFLFAFFERYDSVDFYAEFFPFSLSMSSSVMQYAHSGKGRGG